MLHKNFAPILIASSLLGSFAAHADAAATRSGPTNKAISAFTRGTDVAYDSINKVYLVVGANGTLIGRFVTADGTPIGAPFNIQGNPAIFASFPRVAFSPDANNGTGAFLVTWNESGTPITIHARLVAYPAGGPISGDVVLGGDGFMESGPAVAYATRSKEFLVAWRASSANDIVAVRVNNGALPIAAVAIPPTIDGERDPSVAYNPDDDQFLIVYSGWTPTFAFVRARRVQAGTGAVIDGGSGITISATGGTYITDVTYNASTRQYLASWYALPASASLGQSVNRDGTLSGATVALSTRWKAYDALGIEFNAISNTFFLVSHSPGAEDGGVEINSNGTPIDNGFLVTDTAALGGTGNFYPKITASVDQPNWLVSTATNFTMASVQLVGGTAGGPVAPPPPSGPVPPPAPVPQPLLSVDTPAANARMPASRFFVAGWAIDKGASAGTGIDGVHVWAYPSPGSGLAPVFLGAASLGGSRPDVGTAFGTQFTASGYSVEVGPMWPGRYDLVVYAHSTVTNTFAVNQVVPITVSGFMTIDTPSMNAPVGTTLFLGGWAMDATGAAGTGIDAVHVWVYPNPGSGQPPFFAGAALTGIARPDVAAVFGPRFTNSGYGLLVGGLQSGTTYDLVAFAHSSVSNTFIDFRVTRVTVTAYVTIDTPTAGANVGSGAFSIQGWALDTAAATGTGVDAVHLWAWPTSGAAPVFLGAAAYGSSRPDVGTQFGSPRFADSGFSINVGALSTGTYDVVAYAHSTIDGTFRATQVVRIVRP